MSTPADAPGGASAVETLSASVAGLFRRILADALVLLSERVAELEDASRSRRGLPKSLDKLHRRIDDLHEVAAKKKHVKKILEEGSGSTRGDRSRTKTTEEAGKSGS
jgi:hypothetical protein